MKAHTLGATVGTAIWASMAAGQGLPQLWVRTFATSGGDRAWGVVSDGAGGAFLAGDTQGSVAAPNLGLWDCVLARYDSAGNEIWMIQFGTYHNDYPLDIAPNSAGGFMISGSTGGDLGAPFAGGYQDAYLARYDGSGNKLWIRQLGTSGQDWAWAMADDGAGGGFVGGDTSGALGGPVAGGIDAWLARYDGAGNQQWIRQFGTSAQDQIVALVPDGAGGVMGVGNTGAGLGGPSAGGDDGFLARYDGAGDLLWVRQFGAGGDDYANAVAPDGAGGAYVAGVYGWVAGPNFEGDAFIARFDGSGNELWHRPFATEAWEEARALLPDGGSGVLVAGSTTGSLFGPNLGSGDAFLARFDAAGNQTWGHQFGSSGGEGARGLAVDGAGGAFVAGFGSGSFGGPNAGLSDAFIVRFGAWCYADCTADGALTVADFGCFQTQFVAAHPYADCNSDGAATIADFGCFQTSFVQGCP